MPVFDASYFSFTFSEESSSDVRPHLKHFLPPVQLLTIFDCSAHIDKFHLKFFGHIWAINKYWSISLRMSGQIVCFKKKTDNWI